MKRPNTHLSVNIVPHGDLGGTDFPSDAMPISAEDMREYLRVIEGALEVHLDREAIRHGLWKDYPAEDQSNQVKIKIDRVMRTLEIVKELEKTGVSDPLPITEMKQNAVEELYDIINYSNFAVRKLEGTA